MFCVCCLFRTAGAFVAEIVIFKEFTILHHICIDPMKTKAFIFLLLFGSTAYAQNKKAPNRNFTYALPTQESLLNALSLAGIHISTVVLPPVKKEKYSMILFKEERTKDSLIKEESWNIGEVSAAAVNKLVITLVNKTDSSFIAAWTAPNGNSISAPGKKHETMLYKYFVKPFKPQDASSGAKIPVVLYGSSWYDPKYNIYRFCMENELDPDRKNEAFTLMPHYFVFGFSLEKVPG